MVVAAVYAIESQSQPAHVELPLGEVRYSCTVAYMSYDMVLECLLQLFAAFEEPVELHGREFVELVTVSTHEMREY